MKSWRALACSVLLVSLLTACGAGQATEGNESGAAAYESYRLTSSYEGALDVSAQLALGSLQLDETERPVTAEQARSLLPLWRALQGGVTAEDEVKAVLRGIEGAMTEEQLTAIADMELTQEDVQAWIAEHGMGGPGGFPDGDGDPDARATRRAELGGEGGAPRREGMPSAEDMPPEMATRVAAFATMSEEERAAMMATAEAGGGIGTGLGRASGGAAAGAGDTGMGPARLLLRPLIAMLEKRAG